MEKPGRNDPCYCGSGKKYKQCHMAADLEAERQQRAWNDAARDLRVALLDFADEERFDEPLGAAAARYWNELYTGETLHLMTVSEADRFLDWFLFDYSLPESGVRPVELFQEEQGGRLPAVQRDLLAQWAAAGPMSGYELTGYERQTLHLKEMLSGEQVDVFEPAGHGNAPLGALIIGRVVPVQDHNEFFTLPAYIPPEEITDLPDKLRDARAANGQDDAAAFMRQHNVLIIHHALAEAVKAGRPPVARLDPNRSPDAFPHRQRHERVRIKTPVPKTNETTPHMAQTRRKAI